MQQAARQWRHSEWWRHRHGDTARAARGKRVQRAETTKSPVTSGRHLGAGQSSQHRQQLHDCRRPAVYIITVDIVVVAFIVVGLQHRQLQQRRHESCTRSRPVQISIQQPHRLQPWDRTTVYGSALSFYIRSIILFISYAEAARLKTEKTTVHSTKMSIKVIQGHQPGLFLSQTGK